MGILVISGPLRDQLLAMSAETELRDESGKVLGRFVPHIDIGPEPTPEEIAAQLAAGRKTYTTTEILAYVKGLVS